MKKGVRVITLFLLCSLMLCGCGTSLYEMTEEEENVVVRYAAYVLAKHNVYQKDGMIAVSKELLEESTDETNAGEADTELTEPETDAADEQTQSGQTEGSTSGETGDSLTAAEAGGYDGTLDIAYTGFYTVNNFQEGKAYSMDARSGYEFVVAQFTMKNISGEAQEIDMMSRNLTFWMSYGDGKRVKEDVTLLLTDLSTYTGSLAAEESADVVLLFEVPEEDAAEIDQLTFYVEKDGERYLIR